MPSSSLAVLRRRAQALALKTRTDLGVPLTNPVDVYAAIRQLRLWLLFQPLEGLFGMYQRHGDAAGIVLNVKVHPALQRYTAAHELGHHVMGHTTGLDPESNISRWSNLGQQELAAQMFAAEFLMPLAAVNTAASLLGLDRSSLDEAGIYQLSLRLRTSYSAMITRLQTLGWYGSTRATRFRSTAPKELKLRLLGRQPPDPQGDVWVVTEQQAREAIAPQVGDEVIFNLEENPSTGYRWDPNLPDGLVVEEDRFVEPSMLDGEERIGGSGRRRLFVSVTQEKSSRARMELRPPWDDSETPLAAVDVTVDANLRPSTGVDTAQQAALLTV